MENGSYTTLTRQSGLLRELRVIANNIANSSTTGFRQEGVIFSEYVSAVENAPSLSMALGNIKNTSLEQGSLTQTNGRFDFAIEGDGFFMVEAVDGFRLTRSGSFTPNSEGELSTPDGARLLDAGGAPIFVPPNAVDTALSPDGTLSAEGRPIAQLGLVKPSEGAQIMREDGVRFRVEGEVIPTEGAQVRQGFLENSNVSAISQVARLIEVQRAYELGQSFSDTENERLKQAIQSFFK